MTQIWKDVRDFEGIYQVSNFSRVKHLVGFGCRKERILKQTYDDDGYFRVLLKKRGQKPKSKKVHRLVFEAFYRRLLPNEDCHHINKNTKCNISTNLVARDHSLHTKEHASERKRLSGRFI